MEAGGALLRVASDIPVDAQGTYIFNGGEERHRSHLHRRAPGEPLRREERDRLPGRPKGGFSSSDHMSLAADFSIE